MILGLNKESKNPGSALNAHSVVPIQLGPTDPQVPLANVEHKQHRCRYDDRVWPVAPTLGIGTSAPNARLKVDGGQIVADQSTISGATVDFNTGNVQVLTAPGASALTLNNMVDGGAYTLIITDTTSRTYTFTNCTNSKFIPANAATTAAKQTIYSILKVTVSSAVYCYVTWLSGF